MTTSESKALNLTIQSARFNMTTKVEPQVTIRQLIGVIIYTKEYHPDGFYEITKDAGKGKPVIYLDREKSLKDNNIVEGDTLNFHDIGLAV